MFCLFSWYICLILPHLVNESCHFLDQQLAEDFITWLKVNKTWRFILWFICFFIAYFTAVIFTYIHILWPVSSGAWRSVEHWNKLKVSTFAVGRWDRKFNPCLVLTVATMSLNASAHFNSAHICHNACGLMISKTRMTVNQHTQLLITIRCSMKAQTENWDFCCTACWIYVSTNMNQTFQPLTFASKTILEYILEYTCSWQF